MVEKNERSEVLDRITGYIDPCYVPMRFAIATSQGTARTLLCLPAPHSVGRPASFLLRPSGFAGQVAGQAGAEEGKDEDEHDDEDEEDPAEAAVYRMSATKRPNPLLEYERKIAEIVGWIGKLLEKKA